MIYSIPIHKLLGVKRLSMLREFIEGAAIYWDSTLKVGIVQCRMTKDYDVNDFFVADTNDNLKLFKSVNAFEKALTEIGLSDAHFSVTDLKAIMNHRT